MHGLPQGKMIGLHLLWFKCGLGFIVVGLSPEVGKMCKAASQEDCLSGRKKSREKSRLNRRNEEKRMNEGWIEGVMGKRQKKERKIEGWKR